MARRKDTVRLSSKGQIVIPASVRRELGLKAGRVLRVRSTKQREIVLSPVELTWSEIEDARRRMHDWAKRTGRDLVEELHQRRAEERKKEAQRRW